LSLSELSDGHYWVNDGLIIDKPVKLVGDENNPANVVIEMSGSVLWSGKSGWIEGITFRRPKISSAVIQPFAMLEVNGVGKIDMTQVVFDNDFSAAPTVILSGSGNKGTWDGVIVRNSSSTGMKMTGEVHLEMINSIIKGHRKDGVELSEKASIKLSNCTVEKNKGYGLRFATGCKGVLLKSHFDSNDSGVIQKESHVNITSSSNTATVSSLPEKQIPGFRVTMKNVDGDVPEGSVDSQPEAMTLTSQVEEAPSLPDPTPS